MASIDAARPDLQTHTVDVHLMGFREWRLLPAARKILSSTERRMAATIRSPARHREFIASRAILRTMLAERLRCAPRLVPIVRDDKGRPRLAGSEIEFSLSHSETWCAVAFSTDCAVGVDVEVIRPLQGMSDIFGLFRTQDERDAFDAIPPEEKPLVFYRWWTRMEATAKAGGLGLGEPTSEPIACESCDKVPSIALAVAAKAAGQLQVNWSLYNDWGRRGLRVLRNPRVRTSLNGTAGN